MAEFESGHKNPKSIILHRLAGPPLSYHLPELTYQWVDWFGSKRQKINRDSLLENLYNTNAQSADLILKNMIWGFGDVPFLRAGPADLNYTSRWGRDLVFTLMGLEDPRPLSNQIRDYMKYPYRYPDVPTRQLFGSDRKFFFEDESKAIITFGRMLSAKRGGFFTVTEKAFWQKIVDQVASKFVDGLYQTPAGKDRSWLDTYKFPAGTITYTDLVALAALIGADQQGLRVNPNILTAATKAVKELHPSGYLQLAKGIPDRDLSALMGEHLANLLGETMVPPDVVHETVQAQPKVGHGLANVSAEKGWALDPDTFNPPRQAGDYHNRTNYPLFSAVAMRTDERHGAPVNQPAWMSLLVGLSNRGVPNGEFEGNHGPINRDQAWNAHAYVLAEEALGKEKYRELMMQLRS